MLALGRRYANLYMPCAGLSNWLLALIIAFYPLEALVLAVLRRSHHHLLAFPPSSPMCETDENRGHRHTRWESAVSYLPCQFCCPLLCLCLTLGTSTNVCCKGLKEDQCQAPLMMQEQK